MRQPFRIPRLIITNGHAGDDLISGSFPRPSPIANPCLALPLVLCELRCHAAGQAEMPMPIAAFHRPEPVHAAILCIYVSQSLRSLYTTRGLDR